MSKQSKNERDFAHAYCTDDWCHLCGDRGPTVFAIFWVPENAEHSRQGGRYHRFCDACCKHLARTTREYPRVYTSEELMTEAEPDRRYMLPIPALNQNNFLPCLEFDTDSDEPIPAHNTMRFDVCLSHAYGMVADGEMDPPKLVEDIRLAIIDVVNRHTEWEPEMIIIHNDRSLHNECISYSFD